jgi:hypothetical protein
MTLGEQKIVEAIVACSFLLGLLFWFAASLILGSLERIERILKDK